MRNAFSRMSLLVAVMLLTVSTTWAVTGSSDASTPVNVKVDLKGGTDAITIPQVINYQGKLTDGSGNPITTPQDMTFKFWDAPVAGNLKWQEYYWAVLPDANGIFNAALGSMTPIESIPEAGNCYLEITVGGTTITPRTRIVSAAYAYNARHASVADYAYGNDAWTRVGSDSVLYTVRLLGIARGGAGNVLNGDYTFSHVNFGCLCTTGTSAVATPYATIGGGWGNSAGGGSATVAGGVGNAANGAYATVGGGSRNRASQWCATAGGGEFNTASNPDAVVGGGYNNTASGVHSTVGGGLLNLASAENSVVGGGNRNAALSSHSTVGGGICDTAGGDYATVGGGAYNDARDTGATVGGGLSNTASFKYATVGGGQGNAATGPYATVGGGIYDTASTFYATVGGGVDNTASGVYSTVGGGNDNVASASYAAVGGGYVGAAINDYTTVAGGYSNTAGGPSASGRWAAVGGGYYNTASGEDAVVAGGEVCIASGYDAVVAGGGHNTASGSYATVPGGANNTASGTYGFAANYQSSDGGYAQSAAFNGQTATASSQIRGYNLNCTGTKSFTIDHPLDPLNKILNHYSVESPEVMLCYRGAAVIGPDGRVPVQLPDYFEAMNRNPMVQLTGVGTSDVYVAEKVIGNRFAIGGKPGTEVYWTVTGERKDQSAEISRLLMPVEQLKVGSLLGHSLDDDGLASTLEQLQRMGYSSRFSFRTSQGRQRYEEMIRRPNKSEPELQPQPEK